MELQIRNPNPRTYEVTYHLLKAGEKWEHQVRLIGTEGSNEINLSVSGIPPLNLEKRLQYLIHYPYGCIEQTTSSVFPQLYLDKLLKLDGNTKKRIENNIRKGIKRLGRFQLPNGGFSYWQGSHYTNDWGTSYAGHFLILAKEKGYYVSQSLLDAWANYQYQESNRWRYQKNKALNQAYRLYTLALAGKPNLGAMNRLRANKDLLPAASYRLAAAYALVGQNKAALQLIKDVKYEPKENRHYWSWNYGSDLRDKAMKLETFLLLDEQDQSGSLFKAISEEMKSEAWMSTQTTAFALYAISRFVEGGDVQGQAYSFNYVWNKKASPEIKSQAPVFSTGLTVKNNNTLQVENSSEKTLFVTLTSSGIPKIEEEVHFGKNLDLEIKYFDMDGNPVDIRKLKHGTDFYAEATVSNSGTLGAVKNMALTQLFPSGWEIINTRMLDLGAELKSSRSDFIDYRDDRVDVFFSLNAGEKKRFIVLLNAAYQGEYFLPVSRCSDMYNNEVNAISGGGRVNVVK
jgi:uncharacterized protein YfaS (alpha-2-macroglobulin family)